MSLLALMSVDQIHERVQRVVAQVEKAVLDVFGALLDGILADQVVRRVAVVAGGGGVMAGLHPGFILGARCSPARRAG